MFFRALCPTVMLASVHSGVVSSSFGGQTALVEKKNWDLKNDEKENRRGPRKSSEDKKPVRPKTAQADDEEEDKENRPSPAKGSNKKREARPKQGEVHHAKDYNDNKLRAIPNRCLSPPADSFQRRRPATAIRIPSSSVPIRVITPLANVRGNNGCEMSPQPERRRNTPPSPCLRSSRREQPKQRSSLPLRISDSSLTVNPNQKLSIAYRNDRFYWVTKEVDTSKGY